MAPIRALHVTELRTRIDALRVSGLLGPSFTDPAPIAQYTVIYTRHISALSNAVTDLEQR